MDTNYIIETKNLTKQYGSQKSVADLNIAFSEGSSPEGCDFPQSWSAPNHTGDATLPLRWLPPATLLWTCHLGTPCVASCSQPTSFIKYAIFSIGNEV